VVSSRRELQLPLEAFEICARDLAVGEGELGVIPRTAAGAGHYKSAIYFIGLGASEPPSYVVKLDAGEYDPKHEAESLELAAELLGSCESSSETGLGVVRPVGWGTDPRFLVTRFQSGELAQEAIDRAVLAWRGPRPLAEAHSHARLLGRWLGELRSRGMRPGGGFTPSEYLDAMRERAGISSALLGAGKEMLQLLGRVERLLEQLAEEDVARMAQQYPNRGDARPKNFLVGDDGVLYGFDMEGFGFGPMEHDVSCLHHALEYDGVLLPGARRRASALWTSFLDEYLAHGSSGPFVLLGYLYFLLQRMRATHELSRSAGPKRKVLARIWLRGRLAWLGSLRGDLEADVAHLKKKV
jgi:hypothetical protein